MKIPSAALLLLLVLASSARHSGATTAAGDADAAADATATAPRRERPRGDKALRGGGGGGGRGRKLGKDKDKNKEAKQAKKTKTKNKNKETRTNLEPDLLPSVEGTSSRVGASTKLGLDAMPNGLEGSPVPVDSAVNKLGDDVVNPRPLPAGVLVDQPLPPPAVPVDGAASGSDGGTYTSTGGGVTHTHTPAAQGGTGTGANNKAGGVTARSDPCSSLPPSQLGTVPPANLGHNVMVQAPPSTWAACDESCEGYPNACAHKGYFWTPDAENREVKHLVRACLDLTGLNRWARRGCARGEGDETREVPWAQATSP